MLGYISGLQFPSEAEVESVINWQAEAKLMN